MTLQAEGRKLVNVGNYRLTGKRLGKGNFARVEEAVHSVLNTKVALKIMDVNIIKEDYVIRNLYREARIMSRLYHPCIAALFQTMQYGSLYYLVMELVGGGDLCTFIKAQRSGKLDERCTRVYARQLVSALSHMHNVGIVHRDLKMENVMLNAIHTQIKIVDFGLSNLYSESNPLRTHCGSPEYAAPELFMEGKHYGPEVDLWSLGVILYGMVIGQLPFVSIRENNMTSQERRKKLLEQINKGISAPHRRALCLFSPEFKGMMGKLLIADSTKRITIKELIFHPWITEKGRKAVRSNPLKKLDGPYQAIILKDVGSLLHITLSEVEFAVKSEPHGTVAGIYNILAFRHTLHQMEGDGITRNLPDQSPNYTTPRVRTQNAKTDAKTSDVKMLVSNKRKDCMKSAPVHKVVTKSTPRTPSGRLALTIHKSGNQKSSTKTNEEKSLKKRMIPKVLLTKLEKSSSAKEHHPVSDFIVAPSKRTVSADEHKRLKLSTNQLSCEESSPHPISNILNLSKMPDKSDSLNVRNLQIQNVRITPRVSPIIKDRLATIKLTEGNTLNAHKMVKSGDSKIAKMRSLDKSTPKHSGNRIQSASIEPKSEPLPQPPRRPLTGPTHTAERAVKRRSMLPVTTSISTPSKNTGSTTHAAPLRYRKMQGLKSSDFRETDPVKSPSKNQAERPFLNEPIARSIAGYVVNNIPSKLNAFKWIKTSKKESS